MINVMTSSLLKISRYLTDKLGIAFKEMKKTLCFVSGSTKLCYFIITAQSNIKLSNGYQATNFFQDHFMWLNVVLIKKTYMIKSSSG